MAVIPITRVDSAFTEACGGYRTRLLEERMVRQTINNGRMGAVVVGKTCGTVRILGPNAS